MQKTTIWRQNYKKFLKCASILQKKYHFAYLLSFLAYKWAEKLTKVQRDNVQCTKEGEGERNYDRYSFRRLRAWARTAREVARLMRT